MSICISQVFWWWIVHMPTFAAYLAEEVLNTACLILPFSINLTFATHHQLLMQQKSHIYSLHKAVKARWSWWCSPICDFPCSLSTSCWSFCSRNCSYVPRVSDLIPEPQTLTFSKSNRSFTDLRNTAVMSALASSWLSATSVCIPQ